jgi:hypothetical protein
MSKLFKGLTRSGKSDKALSIVGSEAGGSVSAPSSPVGKLAGIKENDEFTADVVEYKDGDYQLRIHVIECADLMAPSGSGFVCPVVFIDAAGHKVHTKQKRNVSGCIYDESFYIQLNNMSESTIQDANICFTVLDSSHTMSSMFSSKTIGTFSVDLETVYQSHGHEIYRKWAPLLQPATSDMAGKLLVSVSLLGPGDRSVVHDRKAEIAEEKRSKQSAPGASQQAATLFAAPKMMQKLRFLVVEVFKAEGIPVMDRATLGESFSSSLSNHKYISASIAVEFDTHDKVHTGTMHLRHGYQEDADFLTALWLPFADPCYSPRIQLRLLEHHSMSDPEVQSSTLCPSLQLRNVKQGMAGKPPAPGCLDPTQLFWVNLYGAPVPESFKDRQKQKLAKNTYPDRATAYRGRLLVRLRISDIRPPVSKAGKGKKPEIFKCAITSEYVAASGVQSAQSATVMSSLLSTLSFGALTPPNSPNPNGNLSPVPGRSEKASGKSVGDVNAASSPGGLRATGIMGLPLPKTRRYTLRAMVYAGHAFPQRSAVSSKDTVYSVELRLRHRRLLTPELLMTAGYATWDKPILLKETFELPEDAAMLPDLFLYVLNSEHAPLSYKRFSLAELLSRPEDKQFDTPAKWEILRLDDCYSFPSPDPFPGAVLVKMGFGEEHVADERRWEPEGKIKCHQCQVNIHVYQGRGLPPSDSTGLLDPYVLIHVGSQIYKTAVHKQTRDPQFYETLSFKMDLPHDDTFKPHMFLELYDQDLGGDDFVGLLKLDLAQANKRVVKGLSEQQLLAAQLRPPEWHGLRSRTGADLMGQLLVDCEVLALERTNLVPSPPLKPDAPAWLLDFKVLGIRDLEPVGMVPRFKPYAKIALNNEVIGKLHPSKKPTPTDPNYLACFEEVVHLPRDIRFAPALAITVKDRKAAGLPPWVVGAVSIPLDDKLAAAQGIKTSSRSVAQFRPGNPFLSKEDLIASQILMNDSSCTREEDKVRWEDGQKALAAQGKAQQDLEARLAQARSRVPRDDLPEYLHGRLLLDTELEGALLEAPFERYPVTTGSLAEGLDNILDGNFMQVGVLKCSVALHPAGAVASAAHSTALEIAEQDVKVRGDTRSNWTLRIL